MTNNLLTVPNKTIVEEYDNINISELKVNNLNNGQVPEYDNNLLKTILTVAPFCANTETQQFIVGKANSGKSYTTKNLINYYVNDKKYKTAVVIFNEREYEAVENYGNLGVDVIYNLHNSIDVKPNEALKLAKDIFNELTNKDYDLLVIDSISGLYEIIEGADEFRNSSIGAKGYKEDVMRKIWRMLKPTGIKNIIGTSILRGDNDAKGQAIADFLEAKGNSMIFLEKELRELDVYPNVNLIKSNTRCKVAEGIKKPLIDYIKTCDGLYQVYYEIYGIELPKKFYNRFYDSRY